MSLFNHHSVTNQPQANPDLGSLDLKQPSPFHEKFTDASLENGHDHHHCEHEHGQTSFSEHNDCHKNRLRRFLIPAILLIVALGGLLAWSCAHGMPAWGVDLIGRALDDTSTGTSTESNFTKHKLYLIVIFVGLLVVVVLAIMLSAWCCKGAFKNPCCCPCYLCACCGGLACLECIGCGLCAEGLSEM